MENVGEALQFGREALEVLFRFEEASGRIARLRTYAFCPETMRAAGGAPGSDASR